MLIHINIKYLYMSILFRIFVVDKEQRTEEPTETNGQQKHEHEQRNETSMESSSTSMVRGTGRNRKRQESNL